MAKTFTKTDQDNVASVKVNEEFILELAENPTTGYVWQIMVNEGIEIISSDYMLSPIQTAGSSGIHRFIMKVSAPGTSHLAVTLKRSWEDEKTSIDHFEISIEAE